MHCHRAVSKGCFLCIITKNPTTMTLIPMLLQELEQESQTTRKMLALVPEDKYDWKPHTKSMTMRQLATHIAELPSWIAMTLTTEELDFGKNPYEPTVVHNTAELLSHYEKSLAEGKAQLAQTTEERLNGRWVLRNGDEIYSDWSKAETIRHTYCQTVHHRAQLGVYLRLLDIPIPGSYGPSADEMEN